MSITDELRHFANEWDWLDYKADESARSLRAIADRIDAEHESACAEAYGNGVMSVPIALDESACVKLPVDADGVPIRVGEKVQLFGNDPSTVSHMSLADDGWRVYVKYDDGNGTGSGEPKLIRHYRAPTVEDTLHELIGKVFMLSEVDGENELVAEYAKRLRLAGDGE